MYQCRSSSTCTAINFMLNLSDTLSICDICLQEEDTEMAADDKNQKILKYGVHCINTLTCLQFWEPCRAKKMEYCLLIGLIYVQTKIKKKFNLIHCADKIKKICADKNHQIWKFSDQPFDRTFTGPGHMQVIPHLPSFVLIRLLVVQHTSFHSYLNNFK